jgi:hypothetical protein
MLMDILQDNPLSRGIQQYTSRKYGDSDPDLSSICQLYDNMQKRRRTFPEAYRHTRLFLLVLRQDIRPHRHNSHRNTICLLEQQLADPHWSIWSSGELPNRISSSPAEHISQSSQPLRASRLFCAAAKSIEFSHLAYL